jgi:hypothetical protein
MTTKKIPIKGEIIPDKKLGNKVIYFGKKEERKNWIKKLNTLWSQTVLLRDKNTCQYNCGKKEGLAVHHIKPKGRYPKMRFDTDNGLTLCYMHHLGNGGAHLDGTTFGDWFREKYPDRYLWLKRRAQITDRSPMDFKVVELYLNNQLKKFEMQIL